MKKRLILSILLLAAFGLQARAQRKIAGTRTADFTIVYCSALEDEEGIDAARTLRQELAGAEQPELRILPDTAFRRGRAIRLVRSEDRAPFDYAVRVSRGDLLIDGGGSWALTKAAQHVAQMLREGDIPRDAHIEGSVEGECLFARAAGSNLRILADNIWDYSRDDIPEAWRLIGEDPRDDVRAPQFAQLVRAFMPDVLDLQEYSLHMHQRFYPLIRRYGYRIAYEGEEPWNNTPIFYNPETVELVDVNYVLYAPSCWSNIGSKSYTSAVFRKKDTGRLFAVVNTHLWWKSEAAQPGSTYARAAQVRLMMAEAEVLKNKYGCTIFVTGDMNAYEDSLPHTPVHRRGLHALLQGGDGRDRQRQRPSYLRPERRLFAHEPAPQPRPRKGRYRPLLHLQRPRRRGGQSLRLHHGPLHRQTHRPLPLPDRCGPVSGLLRPVEEAARRTSRTMENTGGRFSSVRSRSDSGWASPSFSAREHRFPARSAIRPPGSRSCCSPCATRRACR